VFKSSFDPLSFSDAGEKKYDPTRILSRRCASLLFHAKMIVLASTTCDELHSSIMSMGVKSDKTFEEIVERLSALFRLKPVAVERDYEEPVATVPEEPLASRKPARSRKDKEK
jgi:hypothetical protein